MNRDVRGILKLVTVVVLLSCLFGIAAGQDPQGSIKVTSEPSGAQVYLDGEMLVGPISTTSTTIKAPPGSHTIKLSLFGYQDWW